MAGAVAVSSAVKLAGEFLRRQLLARCAVAAVLLATGTLGLAALSRLGDPPSAAQAPVNDPEGCPESGIQGFPRTLPLKPL